MIRVEIEKEYLNSLGIDVKRKGLMAMNWKKRLSVLLGVATMTAVTVGTVQAETPAMSQQASAAAMQQEKASFVPKAQVWQTLQGHALPLPAGVTIVDGRGIPTPQGPMNVMSPIVKEISAQSIANVAKMLDVPEVKGDWAKQNLVRDVNFYQLQGQRGQTRYTAVGGEMQLNIAAFNEFYRKALQEKVKQAKDDKDREKIQEKLDTLALYPTTYTPQGYMEALLKDARAELAKVQAKKGIITESFNLGASQNGRELLKDGPEVRVVTLQTMEPVISKTALGEGLVDQSRFLVEFGGWQLPLQTYSFINYTPEGMNVSFLMTADAEKDYWDAQVKELWKLPKLSQIDFESRLSEKDIAGLTTPSLDTLGGKAFLPTGVRGFTFSESPLHAMYLETQKELIDAAVKSQEKENALEGISETKAKAQMLANLTERDPFGKDFDYYELVGKDGVHYKTAHMFSFDLAEVVRIDPVINTVIASPEAMQAVMPSVIEKVNRQLSLAQAKTNEALADWRKANPTEPFDPHFTFEAWEPMAALDGAVQPVYTVGLHFLMEINGIQFPYYAKLAVVNHQSRPIGYLMVTTDAEQEFFRPVFNNILRQLQ